RDVRPEARRRESPLAGDHVQHAGDPGGALVLGRPDAEPGGELRVGGAAGEADGARVRDFGEECTERQHHRRLAPARELEDGTAIGLPPEVRLGRDADDEVARELGPLGDGELGRGPDDLTFRLGPRLEADVRPREAEMVELLGIDLGELLGVEGGGEVARGGRRGLGRVVPAAERHDEHGPSPAVGQRVDGEHRQPPRRAESNTNPGLTRRRHDDSMAASPRCGGRSVHARHGKRFLNARLPIAALALTLLTTAGALAAPPDDRVLPVDQYTSPKARTLGARYAAALHDLNAAIYHCLPWLDVPKESNGI